MRSLKLYVLLLFVFAHAFSKAQSIDTLSITSKVFNSTRKVMVALPSGYSSNPNGKYVVAYLFDSQSADFFNYYRSTIKYLTQQGYIQPLILVGIASENRQYEFTPIAQTPQGLKYFQKSGGAQLLARHLKEEVLPLIAQKYRSNGYNIGIGHSLGATFVTYCLLKAPELFNATIAVSPNYQYDDQQLVHKFDSLANSKILNHRYLYLTHGNGDAYEDEFKKGSNKIDSILEKRNITGLRWQFKSMDNDSHGTTAMEGIFKGLIALYRELTISDKQINAFYKDKQTPFVDHMKAYYQTASTWSGLKLPMVDDLNNIGYNCYYAGKNTEAIAVFKWALALYPDNINLYDSMGEIQMNTGNKTEALSYYTKGLAVIKQQQSIIDSKKYNSLTHRFEEQIKVLSK
jgi:predicted alpha/beta superfamily hydrolase